MLPCAGRLPSSRFGFEPHLPYPCHLLATPERGQLVVRLHPKPALFFTRPVSVYSSFPSNSRRGLVWLLVFLTVIASWTADQASQTLAAIILSEVMYDPQNSDANREWVELFNTGTSSVDLSGWRFGRPDANQWTSAFPSGTALAANQALVVTPSMGTFDSDWGSGKNRIQIGGFRGSV